jgi:hypothetical protein
MRAKRIANIVLPLIGVGLMVYYNLCSSSCSFLKGHFLSVDLKYLGLVYPAGLFVLAVIKWDRLFLAGVSFGIGAEINLVWFQIIHHMFCPYCLAFAATVVLLFIINFSRSRKLIMSLSIIAGFVLFLLFFNGMARPVYAADLSGVPSFGAGKVQVRLYTDFFCVPCQRMEPKIEGLLTDLVKRDRITLRFIDVPVHEHSPLYVRYFLYMVNYSDNLSYVLRSRAVLFGAAKSVVEQKDYAAKNSNYIDQKQVLEAYLKKEDVRYRVFDPAQCFAGLQAYLDQDGVEQTPTCVIRDGSKKNRFVGEEKIIKALEALK